MYVQMLGPGATVNSILAARAAYKEPEYITSPGRVRFIDDDDDDDCDEGACDDVMMVRFVMLVVVIDEEVVMIFKYGTCIFLSCPGPAAPKLRDNVEWKLASL